MVAVRGFDRDVHAKKGNGCPPMPLGTMLRIHFMQQWFGYSDSAMEKALHAVPLLRQFAGLDAFEDVMPDECTILRFRHLLEKHDLAVALFSEVIAVLSEKGLSMKRGTVVGATLNTAPSSTKNEDKKRDPEMTQTRKGNQWHFGMKAHIGVDAEICLGDRAYHKSNRTIECFENVGGLSVLVPTKKPKGCDLTIGQKAFNRMQSSVRAIVEHPFRVVKQQFGFVTLFALANLLLARNRLLPLMGEVRP